MVILKNIHKFLYILTPCILADTICDNLIVQLFGTKSFNLTIYLVVVFLLVQIVISPIQAGLSDFYCRKKSLIVALLFSLFSLFFVYLADKQQMSQLFIIFIIIALKGPLGNTIPISWAGIADVQKKGLRFALAIATAPYALGYLFLNYFNEAFSKTSSDLFTIILYIVLIILVVVFFEDLKDKDRHHGKEKKSFLKNLKPEFIALKADLFDKIIWNGLLAYFLWSVSLYCFLVLFVDFQTPFYNVAKLMMYGYLVGVALMKFYKRMQDDTVVYLGYIVSIIALGIIFVSFVLKCEFSLFLSISYCLYGMGNAYLSPSILTILSKERYIHQQGRVFGLIASVDTLGFLVSTIIILIYRVYDISIIYLISFSGMMFFLSWFPFARNKKLRKIKQAHSS